MKNNLISNTLYRLGAAFLSVLLLVSLTSCGKPDKDPWYSFGKSKPDSAIEKLEMKLEDLKAQVTGGKTHADKAAEQAALWQAVAAVSIVLAGFALIYGAALGSQARRVNNESARKSSMQSQSEEVADEIVL